MASEPGIDEETRNGDDDDVAAKGARNSIDDVDDEEDAKRRCWKSMADLEQQLKVTADDEEEVRTDAADAAAGMSDETAPNALVSAIAAAEAEPPVVAERSE